MIVPYISYENFIPFSLFSFLTILLSFDDIQSEKQFE